MRHGPSPLGDSQPAADSAAALGSIPDAELERGSASEGLEARPNGDGGIVAGTVEVVLSGAETVVEVAL